MVVVGDNDTYLALPFGTYACILERFQYFGLKRMLRDFSNDPDRLLWICRIGNEGLRSLEGISCHLEEVALPFSVEVSMAQQAREFARTWYAEEPWEEFKEELGESGISLGEVVEWEMVYFFNEVLGFIEKSVAFLKEKRPKSLLALGHPAYLEVLGQIAESCSIPTEIRPFHFVPWLQKQLWRRWGNVHLFSHFPEAGRPRDLSRSTDVMFLIPGGNFAKTVLGLRPHLEAKGIHSSLLAWNGGARFLRSQSTSFQCFRDYFQVPTRPGWEDYRRFRRLWPKVRKLLRERPLLYQGVSLRPLLEEKLRHLCWRRWPDVVHAISVIQTILRAERPAVVVSGFDAAWLDMIFIRLAEAQGKACSLSALMGTFDYSWLPPFKARWLAAQGARTRDLYLQQGVSPDRIQVVGQPRYDNVHRVGDTPDRETFGIFPRQRVLVYATEPGNFISSRREKEVHEEALIRFFHGREEYFLLILLHPSDPGVVANCLLKKYRAKNIRVLPGGNPYGLMALCDVWVTAYSTTASEALIYEKPVLLMNFFGRHYLSELVERELAVYVYRSDELAPRIEEALRFKASSDFRERARTYVEWEFHYLDGQSGQRLAQMIAEKAGHVAKS